MKTIKFGTLWYLKKSITHGPILAWLLMLIDYWFHCIFRSRKPYYDTLLKKGYGRHR